MTVRRLYAGVTRTTDIDLRTPSQVRQNTVCETNQNLSCPRQNQVARSGQQTWKNLKTKQMIFLILEFTLDTQP